MFIIKNNYYIYIDNFNDLNISNIKKNKKINIIYRNFKKKNINEIVSFRKKCNNKKFKFFIANDIKLAKKTKSDGLYISAHNKKKYYSNIKKIGSAHNLSEINQKTFQNCDIIIFSRLFKTSYIKKKTFLGVLKFNLLNKNFNKQMIPLGGINYNNLLKLKIVKSEGFAFSSAAKKKPIISNRLF